MTMLNDAPVCAMGEAVPRVEDHRLTQGRGRFVDDITSTDMCFAYVLRSPEAHARIRSIDTEAAAASPGVLAILTGQDVLRDGLGHLFCKFFPGASEGAEGSFRPPHTLLATNKVRHVGDRVAIVVADTYIRARDAAELIHVDYERLPAVLLEDSLGPDAAKVWDESDSNRWLRLEAGDRAKTERAFAVAAHTIEIQVRYPRMSANPIEPRSVLAAFDPSDGRITLHTATQAPFRVREIVCAVLRLPETSVRVVSPDVGGGFGMKGQVYAEEILAVWAAGKLGRPVKWTADRSESFASDVHGRDQLTRAALALAKDGKILAIKAETSINIGAYLCYSGGVAPVNAGTSYASCYDVPAIHTVVEAFFTNTSPVGPYRGSGKPEASYVLERLIDKAAQALGMDPVAIRKRNLIAPAAIPYRTTHGLIYDSGAFERVLDRALELADWNGLADRRVTSAERGRLRGIGLAMHCQPAGHHSERMEIRVGSTGAVALHVGTVATGQGHETMFAQMVSGWLGVPFDSVRVFQGDTDKILFGRGTWGQRSMIAGGSALRGAADEVVNKGKVIAAWMLNVHAEEVDFDAGFFGARGRNRSVGFAEVAAKSYAGNLPAGLGFGLSGIGTYTGPHSFPNGCMVAEVELDPLTGKVTVERISSVDDIGAAVNPHALEGQLHGSIAQGLGESLMETIVYESGTAQLLSGSFQDYAMPRAASMPTIVSDLELVPCNTNPLGVKGGAEAGNVGAPPAIVNAVINALAPWGITDIEIPLTPERIWRSINSAVALT